MHCLGWEYNDPWYISSAFSSSKLLRLPRAGLSILRLGVSKMDLQGRLREKVDEWLGRTEPAAPAVKKRAKTEAGGPSPLQKVQGLWGEQA